MRILAYTPDAPTESHKIVSAFVAGLARYGHHVAFRAIHHYDGPEPCDLAITIGWTPVAASIHKDQLSKGKPTLSISDGFIRKGTGPGAYYAITRNGFGAYGDKVNGCKQDRWDALGIELAEWRKPSKDGHILIAHQHTKTHQGGDRQDWFTRVVAFLRKTTERKIIVRGHPRDPKFTLPVGCEASTNNAIEDDLKNAHALITYDSNAVVEALVAGVPCFTFGRTMGDPLCLHDLNQLEEPPLATQDERQQWANNLAYSQWTVEEMREGLPWLFLTNTSLPMGKTIATPDLPESVRPEGMDTGPDITPDKITDDGENDVLDPANLLNTDEPLEATAKGANNVPPPSKDTEDAQAEPSPEELAEKVDTNDPAKATVKQLMAWLFVHGEKPAANTPKAHLVTKVIQVANS